jgi:UDP-glucose 4-epimerase
MRKIIITGACGFIGQHVTDRMVRNWPLHQVHTIDLLPLPPTLEALGPAVTHHIMDLAAAPDILLEQMFEDTQFVVHLAAFSRVEPSIIDPWASFHDNVLGSHRVFMAATTAKVERVVFASSSAVYGEVGKEHLPTREDAPCTPLSPYAAHKYMAEEYAKMLDLVYGLTSYTCLRFFNVFGPGMPSAGPCAPVLGKWLSQHERKLPITVTGDGSQSRDFVHVDDVYTAIELSLTHYRLIGFNVLNVGSGKSTTLRELAACFPGKVEYRPARSEPSKTQACVDELQCIGWRPTVDVVEWVKEVIEST